MKRWYVAYTQQGSEILAEGQLANQGFKSFLPRCVKTVRHARKNRSVIAPLFPRYIFVQIDLSAQRWRSINGTRGISYLLSMGDRPSAVPSGVVEEIMNRSGENNIIEIPTEIPYESGESIEITDGAMVDQVGKFVRVDARQRVVMLLNLLGRESEVHVEAESVRAFA